MKTDPVFVVGLRVASSEDHFEDHRRLWPVVELSREDACLVRRIAIDAILPLA